MSDKADLAAADRPRVLGERLEVPNSSGIDPPAAAIPLGATDCHHHIFDPRFPGHMRTVGTVDDYRLFKRRLGLTRSVVVAPNGYGTDNRCLLDALAAFGEEARGVAIVSPEADHGLLSELAASGVRGIRLYLVKGTPLPQDGLLRLGSRIADRGWHIQIMASTVDKVIEYAPALARLPCPVVLDHIAYIPQPDGAVQPGAEAVRRLVELGHVWLKLSGVYFTSQTGFPDYSDVDGLAADFVRRAPDRMLWGSDWPHSGAKGRKPDGALLLDQLARWAPQQAVRDQILVDNPNAIYWAS